MPVFAGCETMLKQLMQVRRDAVDVEELPPGDLFGQDQPFLQIAVEGVDDLAVIVQRKEGFGDEAAFRKIVDDQGFLYGAPEQRVGFQDLPERVRQTVVLTDLQLEMFDG